MSNPVLITYASAYGSTIDVAAAIGKTLGAQGLPVRVAPIAENPSIDGEPGCRAVLIGSAVHSGRWLLVF